MQISSGSGHKLKKNSLKNGLVLWFTKLVTRPCHHEFNKWKCGGRTISKKCVECTLFRCVFPMVWIGMQLALFSIYFLLTNSVENIVTRWVTSASFLDATPTIGTGKETLVSDEKNSGIQTAKEPIGTFALTENSPLCKFNYFQKLCYMRETLASISSCCVQKKRQD